MSSGGVEASRFDELVERARDVSKLAYCPYSRFSVGAAILSSTGRVYVACNVENASYGLTCCAERNAVFQMVSHGDRSLSAIVIYTPTAEPSAPCGACRQVLNEFAPNALLVSVCDGDHIMQRRIHELLPEAFGSSSLEGSVDTRR